MRVRRNIDDDTALILRKLHVPVSTPHMNNRVGQTRSKIGQLLAVIETAQKCSREVSWAGSKTIPLSECGISRAFMGTAGCL